MSHKKTVFDPEGVIKNVEISTTYISGLQSILMTMMSFLEDKTTLPETLAKFKKLVEGNTEIQLSPAESQLYIVISLIQELKRKAIDQGLSSEVEISDDVNAKIEEMSQQLLDLDESDDDSVKEFTEKYKDMYKQVYSELNKEDKSS